MYILTRLNDGLIRKAPKVAYVEFDSDGYFKEKHEDPRIGCSVILSPFNIFYTWQTTLITKIHKQDEDFMSFSTQNSEYELRRVDDVPLIEEEVK